MTRQAEGGTRGADTDGPTTQAEGGVPPPVEPWRLRTAAALEVFACSGFPTQLAIAAALAAAGLRPFDAAVRLSSSYVFILSLADAVALLGLVWWFMRLHGERPGAVLLGARPVVREGLLGILQVPVVFLLAIAVMAGIRHAAPWLHNLATNPMEHLLASRVDAAVFALVAIVGGGLREEVQRAFILHRFEQHLGGAWVGLVLFSAAFGAGHAIQGRDVALTTAALGLFWGVVYLRRRSVASSVVSHSAFNATEILRFALR